MSDLASKCAEEAEDRRQEEEKMSEPNTFGQPNSKKSAASKNTDGEERIPMCGSKVDADFDQRMREWCVLVDQREYLIREGVDHACLLIPIRPRRISDTTALPYKPFTNIGECMQNQDEQEALLKAKKRVSATRPLPHGPGPDAMYQHEGSVTREKIDAMSREEIAKVGAPLAEYVFDGNPNGKDSNPKEAFGSRKAGTSCIPTQVKYELGLAMLEGALKYGRHNYRIAGVRGSTYYDACGRHMDDWWEGEDLDPKSGAKLHHIVKAMAGLAVLRDSILAGNWTDDRPPRIGDPHWLDWYNEQAQIMVDACKAPKPPYTELEHSK